MSCCGVDAPTCHSGSLFNHSEVPLSAELKQQVHAVHPVIQAYLEASVDGGKGRLTVAEAGNALENLVIEPAFSPADPVKHRQLLLSITSLYWLATISTLSPTKSAELASRLKDIPTFGSKVPQFTGEEVDPSKVSELSAGKLEALMRCTLFVVVGLVEGSTVEMWRELSDLGGKLWEIEI